MKARHLLSILAATAAIAGCGSKKDDDEPPPRMGPPPETAGGDKAPAPVGRPSQGPLPTLPPVTLPDDPQRAAKVALGHALFFDKRLSVDGTRACYSCHQNEDGNGGHDPIAIGPGEKKLTRHSPVIWDVGYLQGAFYWDGRSKTLEEQAKAALAGGNMALGKDKVDAKAVELAAIKGYKPMFEAAFPGQAPTGDLLAAALSEYERTLVCEGTAYDRYAGGDKTALSEPQQRGLDVFLGKGQCTVCHAPPFFSTAMGVDGGIFFNTGVGTDKPEGEVDVGRMSVTSNAADWAAFKPPSLRNVARSAPYFHDGSVASLDEAVKFMAGGGRANKNRSPLLADRALTDGERADLIAFLGALDCPGKLEAPKLP